MGVNAGTWRDKKARSLREAARTAAKVAATEHLPIAASLGTDALRWHAEAMLKTVPVHGLRDGQAGLAGGTLDAALIGAHADNGDWSELTVDRRDFDAYLAWLRTVW
jgi:hypothetical protein